MFGILENFQLTVWLGRLSYLYIDKILTPQLLQVMQSSS